jgi:hypothetical protein
LGCNLPAVFCFCSNGFSKWYSTGIVHWLVNGTPVIRNGALTGEKPGRVFNPRQQ